jgi:hypothetical protein
VRFEFHLKDDDPLDVAKEMVTHLGISETDVEGISLTISDLAAKAKNKEATESEGQEILPGAAGTTASTSNPALQNSVGSSDVIMRSEEYDDNFGAFASQESEEENSRTTEELKLEDDYLKNMQRAKKAYMTRMDNLHKSKAEKEEQHRRAIEKVSFGRRAK